MSRVLQSAEQSEAKTIKTSSVARTLGIPPRRVRRMAQVGVCVPQRRGRALRFSFQDIVLLRTAIRLAGKRVPITRLGRAFTALARQLVPSQPLSGVRLFADRKEVAARTGSTVWQPESGQILFAFVENDSLSNLSRVTELKREKHAAPLKAIDSMNGFALFESALELERRGDRTGAEEAYRRTLSADPSLVDAYINLGRLEHLDDRIEEAAQHYRRALELVPYDPVVHYNLALALEDQHLIEQAIEHYRLALEQDEKFADAHFNLARLLEDRGHRQEALQHLLLYKQLSES